MLEKTFWSLSCYCCEILKLKEEAICHSHHFQAMFMHICPECNSVGKTQKSQVMRTRWNEMIDAGFEEQFEVRDHSEIMFTYHCCPSFACWYPHSIVKSIWKAFSVFAWYLLYCHIGLPESCTCWKRLADAKHNSMLQIKSGFCGAELSQSVMGKQNDLVPAGSFNFSLVSFQFGSFWDAKLLSIFCRIFRTT